MMKSQLFLLAIALTIGLQVLSKWRILRLAAAALLVAEARFNSPILIRQSIRATMRK